MALDDFTSWAKLLALVPGLLAAWKLPAAWGWLKMKLTTAIASALMAQISPELQNIHAKLEQVHHQVFPNGGGSMSDMLTRVDRNIAVLQGTMRAHQDADLTQARFEADADGHFTWASHALLRWCNRGIDQVVGFGWINCIAMADRDRVREEWEAALEERREFLMQFRLRDVVGTEFPVEAFAKPIHGQWVGVITRVAPAR